MPGESQAEYLPSGMIYLLEKREFFVILVLNIAEERKALPRRKKQVLDDPFLSAILFTTIRASISENSGSRNRRPGSSPSPANAPPFGKTGLC
jgi:hypothetical protein